MIKPITREAAEHNFLKASSSTSAMWAHSTALYNENSTTTSQAGVRMRWDEANKEPGKNASLLVMLWSGEEVFSCITQSINWHNLSKNYIYISEFPSWCSGNESD